MADPNPWDSGDLASSLSDAIRRQADTQKKIATHKKAAPGGGQLSIADPFQQLMQQIQSIRVEETPYDILMQQATGSAGAQFDPLIEQLKAEMGRTEMRGKQNQNTAKQMYGDLATDIAAEMPQITNQMAQSQKETQGLYDQTQNQLKGQYNQQAQQQAELLKNLGIQAAAPDASQQATEDQAYFQNQSQAEETSAIQLLKEMGNADVSYNRQSADNTRLTGVNVAQDIGAQLEDYLATAGGKLGGLQAGRQSAVSAALAQLQQQDAQRVQSQEESEYNRLMDMFNLQLKMQEMQMKNASKGQDSLFKGTNGPTGMANYLAEVYPDDNFTSQKISEAINDVMGSPEAIAGKYNSKEKDMYGQPRQMDVNNEYLIDMLRRRLNEGDLDPNTPNNLGSTTYSDFDVNNAINALMAMMGKLK